MVTWVENTTCIASAHIVKKPVESMTRAASARFVEPGVGALCALRLPAVSGKGITLCQRLLAFFVSTTFLAYLLRANAVAVRASTTILTRGYAVDRIPIAASL